MKYLLWFYYLGIVIFGIFAAISINQLNNYKLPKDKSFIAIIVFLFISGVILLYSFGTILSLNWK